MAYLFGKFSWLETLIAHEGPRSYSADVESNLCGTSRQVSSDEERASKSAALAGMLRPVPEFRKSRPRSWAVWRGNREDSREAPNASSSKAFVVVYRVQLRIGGLYLVAHLRLQLLNRDRDALHEKSAGERRREGEADSADEDLDWSSGPLYIA